MKATDTPSSVSLSHRLSPAFDEKKNRAVPDTGSYETHVLIENLEPMQPHHVFLGIHGFGIKRIERRPLDGNHGLGFRSVHSHRVPQLGHLHTDVKNRLVTGAQPYYFTVGPNVSYEWRSSHEAAAPAAVVDLAGGSELRKRAIC